MQLLLEVSHFAAKRKNIMQQSKKTIERQISLVPFMQSRDFSKFFSSCQMRCFSAKFFFYNFFDGRIMLCAGVKI